MTPPKILAAPLIRQFNPADCRAQAEDRPGKRLAAIGALLLISGLLSACGTPSSKDYFRYAERHLANDRCGSAIDNYASVISHEKIEKNMTSANVDEAILKLHNLAPTCSERGYVLEYVMQAADNLSEARPEDAERMLDLFLTLSEQSPLTYVDGLSYRVFPFLNKRTDDARWQRAFAILMDRGVWKSGDVDFLLKYDTRLQSGNPNTRRASVLRDRLANAKIYADQATGGRCGEDASLDFCHTASGVDSLSPERISYLNAFAKGLEANGLAGSSRVAVVKTLANDTTQKMAAAQARREARAAELQRDQESSNAWLNTFTAVAGAIVQARTGSATPPYKAPARTSTGSSASQAPTTYGTTGTVGSATNSPAKSGTENDPFTYSKTVNECISIKLKPGSVATERITNSCGFAVNITHCGEGTVTAGDLKGRQVNECSRHIMGATALAAGESTYWNPSTAGVETRFIACRQPYYLPSTRLQWNGSHFTGACLTRK